MTKRLLPCIVAAAVLLSSGCLFSKKKNRTPKENPAIATEVETEFHQRWMARRIAELGAQGVTGTAAQDQANREFQEKYGFAVPVKK